MVCNSAKMQASNSLPTDIITYRYNGELVYVPAVPNYNQAISHARDAFPKLRDLGDASLSFCLTVPGQEHKLVGISAPAWPKIMTHMSRYQIIDVHTDRTTHEQDGGVTGSIPEITITYADSVDDAKESDPAPPYQGPDIVDNEKAPYSRIRTLSASTLQSAKRNWFFQKLHGH